MRDHPLMSFRGQPNWPPAWVWLGEGKNKYPQGEVGVLKGVRISISEPDNLDGIKPQNRVYLTMEYLGARYLGCLLFDDAAACRQIAALLAKQRGRRVAVIGALDLRHLL